MGPELNLATGKDFYVTLVPNQPSFPLQGIGYLVVLAVPCIAWVLLKELAVPTAKTSKHGFFRARTLRNHTSSNP